MISDESNSFVVLRGDFQANTRLQFTEAPRPGYLSVIIPVYSDAAGLVETLKSFRANNFPPDRFEIIVGNDGGEAAVSEVCREFGAREVVIIPNGGSYHARNRAMEKARGEYLGFVDADVEVSPRWVEAAFAAMTKWDMAGGRMEVKLGKNPSLIDLYQAFFLFENQRPDRKLLIFATANLVIKRKIFEDLAGFDQRLRSGGDVEFSNRVELSQKYTLGFDPDLAAKHPCRTYPQWIQRIKRVHYGRYNMIRSYGSRFNNPDHPPPSIFRLLFPSRSLFQKELRPMELDWLTFTRLYFFAWWMKLRTIPIILSVKYHMAREER